MAQRMKLKMSSRILRKKSRRNMFSTNKHCRFCASKAHDALVDYKNASLLKSFITERGKVLPARISGACARHQRSLTTEIKKARVMALLPFVATTR